MLLTIEGSNNGKLSVVITAKHNDNSEFPHIRRVKETAAMPAGAIAKRNTPIAISSPVHHTRP